jgi:hypothetical protein
MFDEIERFKKLNLEPIALKAIEAARAIMLDQFTDQAPPKRLTFHVAEHMFGVVERAVLLGRALGLSEQHITLLVIAASFHDSVLNWGLEHKYAMTLRRMYKGANEEASVGRAHTWMRYESGHSFGVTDYELVEEAILVTIPTWDPNARTLVQDLRPVTHKIARAVALADIGEAGMDNESFGKSGTQIFLEENIDIVMALVTDDDLTTEKQLWFKERYITWLEGQVLWVEMREAHLPIELQGLSHADTEAVMKLFTRFPVSKATAENNARVWSQAPFTDVVQYWKQFL